MVDIRAYSYETPLIMEWAPLSFCGVKVQRWTISQNSPSMDTNSRLLSLPILTMKRWRSVGQ